MRALIFNSGLGRRLGDLTADRPKAMVRLGNGETIFHRQLRVLSSCGVREFVVTTGPHAGQLEAEAASFGDRGCTFEFVPNPDYADTNYIYSMYLAREHLRGRDILLLHGDLVFDAAFAQSVIDSGPGSLGAVDASLPLPDKDFKARVVDGEVREVSVGIFDGDCVAFQPFYRLSEEAVGIWLSAVERLVEAGDTGVYAENAANTVFDRMHVAAFSYGGHLVEEVDTPEDLARVSAAIRLLDFGQQPVFELDGGTVSLATGFAAGALAGASTVGGVLGALGARRPLVVTGGHFPRFDIKRCLDEAGVRYTVFSGFSPNPTSEQVADAVGAFIAGGCDSLVGVGGGSAIDVAKCVKASAGDGGEVRDVRDPVRYSDVPLVAVPTTAGTGSESTHFAVCYVEGVKTSVAGDCLQPDAVLLDPSNLVGLPGYQRRCTMLDALCQAIESHWSIRSSELSRGYSAGAIPVIMGNAMGFLSGDEGAAHDVMRAANLAGKAINLTTTTAPHAMSYKLTSLYGIPHGHAVAMCMPHLWRMLVERGDGEVQRRLGEIAALMTGDASSTAGEGLASFERLCSMLGVASTVEGEPGDVDLLAGSVNAQRLANFPLRLSDADIKGVYQEIIGAV